MPSVRLSPTPTHIEPRSDTDPRFHGCPKYSSSTQNIREAQQAHDAPPRRDEPLCSISSTAAQRLPANIDAEAGGSVAPYTVQLPHPTARSSRRTPPCVAERQRSENGVPAQTPQILHTNAHGVHCTGPHAESRPSTFRRSAPSSLSTRRTAVSTSETPHAVKP